MVRGGFEEGWNTCNTSAEIPYNSENWITSSREKMRAG
jgi:hypothetical protein